MVKSGSNVTLRIAKQGAIYHGLATLLSQPSPMISRGNSSSLKLHSNGNCWGTAYCAVQGGSKL